MNSSHVVKRSKVALFSAEQKSSTHEKTDKDSVGLK